MKKIKKLTLLFGVALTLLTPVLGLFPPTQGKAVAATIDTASLQQQLESYIFMRGIGHCLKHQGLRDGAHSNIDQGHASNYEWFTNDTDAPAGDIGDNKWTWLGIYDPDDQNGYKECSDSKWMSAGFQLWGWDDYTTALCNSGFKSNVSSGDDTVDECISKATHTSKDLTFSRAGSHTDSLNAFLRHVNQTYYGKDDTSLPTMSDAMKYLYYSQSFLVLCGNNPVAKSDPNSYTADNLKEDHLFKMSNGDNPETFSVYETPKDFNGIDMKHDTMVYTRTTDDFDGYVSRTCLDLVNLANGNASAYATYMNDHPDDPSSGGVGAVNDGTTTDTQLSCGGFNLDPKYLLSLEWLICPMVKGFMNLAGQLENEITKYLCINESDIFGVTATCANGTTNPASQQAFHDAWNVFRTIALGLLAIGGLVMVISQALGFEFIDVYTIKKTLPRILVAAIGITLSWPLLQFLVTFSNVIGIGVRSLIYSPFQHAAIDNINVLSGGDSIILALSGSASFIALGALGLLSFAASAALAVLIAFFTLIIRNILIIFLILISPIAIAAYILPNTEKYWKTWWEWLFKGLMVFPIITGMIALGHVFAAITATKGGGTLTDFVAFAAYFAPYFLIPAAFRLAGGAMATIGGITNDRSRGGFDRLKKFRQGQTAKNWNKTRNFDRFSERSRVGRALNTTLGAASNPTSMLGGAAGVRARRNSHQSVHGAAMLKENKIFQANQNDDNFLLALANRDLAEEKLRQAQGKRDTATNAGDRNRYQAEIDAREQGLNNVSQMSWFDRENRSTRLAALDGLTRTGYQFSDGAQGYKELNDTVSSIVGGDERARAQILDSSQFNLKSAGRFDLGGINHGAGYNSKTGLDKASLYELANGKSESIKTFGQALPAGAVGEEHAVAYKELEALLPNTKGAVRDETVKQMQGLEARGIREHMATTTTEQQVVKLTAGRAQEAAARGNPWTVAELNQGWRHENRTITQGDIASRKARAYERPDPNQHQP